MNTITDLKSEMNALSAQAPTDAEVRAALAHRIERHAKRRRTTALMAAAAAVVVVAGGAGITGAVLSHRSAGPASPTPVVAVPDVPLPPDTKLIRHQLQPVTSPVTATPPKGLTGHMWMSAPGRLAVSYFNPDAASHPDATGNSDFGWVASDPQSPSGGVVTAGYTITNQREEALRSYGPDGPTTPTVTRTPITVGGHAATLDTAPSDTDDQFGFPANRRISWQLADGHWIHVWASGPPGWFAGDDALESFAASVTETPQTLDRTVGIGLTMPGLTVDSSMNSWPAVAYIGASVYLCPKGVDPMTPSYGSSTGSGSSNPDGSSTGSSVEATSQAPTARCIAAAVLKAPSSRPGDSLSTETMTVGDTVVHVDTKAQVGWVDLGNGVTTMAGPPRGAHLSAADLAALAASVRLSPAATMLPISAGQVAQGHGQGGVATVVTSASAVPMPSPITASTDRPGQQPGSSAGAASSSAAVSPSTATPPVPSSPAANSQPAGPSANSAASVTATTAAAAAQLQVVTAYLDAVKARDCTLADRHWTDGKAQFGNGDLCHGGSLRLLGYRIDGAPATPSPTEATVAVTITITGGDESMPDGDLTWFFDLQRQPDGAWLIAGGGTGP